VACSVPTSVKVEPRAASPGRKTAAAGGQAAVFENYTANKRASAFDVATEAGLELVRLFCDRIRRLRGDTMPSRHGEARLDPPALQAVTPLLI